MKTLSSSRWAEALAHLHYFRDETQATVFAALGYDAEQFAQQSKAIKAALRAAVDDGDVGPMREYVRAYDIVQRRLRARRPTLSGVRRLPGLEPTITRRVVVPDPPMVPLPSHAAEAAVGIVVPSYLQQSDGSEPEQMRPVDVNATMMTDGRQILEGLRLPFVDPKLAPAFVPSTSNTESAADDAEGGTMLAPMDPEIRAALPFAATPPTNLEAYLQLTIALASNEDRAAVLARFGLSEAERERFSQAWAERIAKDPDLAMKFRARLLELRGR